MHVSAANAQIERFRKGLQQAKARLAALRRRGPLFLRNGVHKSVVDSVFDFMFGYDLFICYSRQGWGETYAVALAQALSQSPKLQCFVDAERMETGLRWEAQGRRALRKSKKIVLLATPKVIGSKGVKDELDHNLSLNTRAKPVTIIDVAGAWETVKKDADFVARLPSRDGSGATSLRIDEPDRDRPSSQVVAALRNDFTIRSEETRRLRFLSAVVGLFVDRRGIRTPVEG